MKSFRLIIILFIAVVCSGGYCRVALAVVQQKDDVNTPAKNEVIKSEPNDSGDANNNGELLSAAEVEGPNTPDGYIGGDAFNLGFTGILKGYVNQHGLVNYAKLRRFRLELNDAVEKFYSLKPEVYITWSRNEKIAFWINAYNICTLKGIIENYPVKPSRFMLLFYPANSVMHISGLRDQTYFMIMGIQYTLDEIERDVLLGRFEEPRSCFAVSYGTMGSAPLKPEPYIGKVLEKQLDEQMRNYFSRPDALRIDETNNVVYLSPIFKMYKWHEDAFLKRYETNKLFREYLPVDRAILNFVKDFISEPNANFLKRKQYSIEYIKYNWQLNEQPAE
ncbi:MAG: DUF547 domain-containing protein [Phycisphaerae bacterium]|jgi:hypothetical protein